MNLNKAFRRLAALTLCLLLFCVLTGCGGAKSQVRATLNRFESACQQLDLNAMLDCVDPDTAELYRAGAGLVGGLAGMDSEETLDSIAPLLFGENYTSSEVLTSLKLKVDDIAVSGSNATALCTLSYTASNGEPTQRELTVTLIQAEVDGARNWYISDIR